MIVKKFIRRRIELARALRNPDMEIMDFSKEKVSRKADNQAFRVKASHVSMLPAFIPGLISNTGRSSGKRNE